MDEKTGLHWLALGEAGPAAGQGAGPAGELRYLNLAFLMASHGQGGSRYESWAPKPPMSL